MVLVGGIQMGSLSVYGITKIGIMHLTGWVARELGPYNIRCNAIAPGLIKTDFGFVGVDGVRRMTVLPAAGWTMRSGSKPYRWGDMAIPAMSPMLLCSWLRMHPAMLRDRLFSSTGGIAVGKPEH